MSWKLTTLSIGPLTAVAAALLLGGPIQRAKAACCGSHATSAAAVVAGERADLSDSDKELIKKQKICPVTGQALGSMGDPIKVTAKGRSIFLCCAGCKKKFFANPEKYFKKLDEQKSDKK
jgi:YHS domain-containing protein